MPYIEKSDRKRLLPNGFKTADRINKTGELCYLIYEVILYYQKQNGLSWTTINDILGALEGTKIAYHNEFVSDYEKNKIKINGPLT